MLQKLVSMQYREQAQDRATQNGEQADLLVSPKLIRTCQNPVLQPDNKEVQSPGDQQQARGLEGK